MRVVSVHKSSERGLPRPEADVIVLVPGKGVEGDRKAGKRPDRQVLLVGNPTYDYLRDNGLVLIPGSLGENLVVDFDPMTLEPGTRLEIGGAVLEISLRCSPCAHLYQTWPRIKGLVSGRRGMLARVLQGGAIKPGDAVKVSKETL